MTHSKHNVSRGVVPEYSRWYLVYPSCLGWNKLISKCSKSKFVIQGDAEPQA